MPTPVTALELSITGSEIIAKLGVDTVEELAALTAEQYLSVAREVARPSVAPKCFKEITEIMADMGLRFAE